MRVFCGTIKRFALMMLKTKSLSIISYATVITSIIPQIAGGNLAAVK